MKMENATRQTAYHIHRSDVDGLTQRGKRSESILHRSTRMQLTLVLAFISVHLSLTFGQDQQQDAYIGPCPSDGCNSTSPDADVIIGGLLPVQGSQGSQSCSKNLTRGTISMWQGAEVIRWAVDLINNDTNLLPDIRLGYDVRDGCATQTRSLEAAVSFLNTASQSCTSQNTTVIGSLPILGIVGAFYSSNSEPVAALLRLFKIPMISPASTSSALDDKCQYPNFFRTIPSDSLQAQALVAISQKNNWKYVSVIYTNDAYGTNGAEGFRDLALRSGICIGLFHSIQAVKSYESDEHLKADYTSSLQMLLTDDNPDGSRYVRAKVVLLWMVSPEATEWLRLANQDTGMQSANFTFLAVSGWSSSLAAVQTANITDGAIGVTGKVTQPATIIDYMASLRFKPERPGENPWLSRVYSEIYGCDVNSNTRCAYLSLGELHEHMYTNSDGGFSSTLVRYLPATADAVYALAHALDSFLNETSASTPACLSDRRRCLSHLATPDGRDDFLRHLGKVQFVSNVTGRRVGFVRGNPPESTYEYFNVRQSGAEYKWEQGIGECDTANFDVSPNSDTCIANITQEASTGLDSSSIAALQPSRCVKLFKPILYHGGTAPGVPPISVCSTPCQASQEARVTNSQTRPNGASALRCCWNCSSCPGQSYSPGQFARCKACSPTHRLNLNGTGCDKVPIERWENNLAAAIPLVILVCLVLSVVVSAMAWLLVKELASAMPMRKSLSLLTMCLIAFSCLSVLLFGIYPSKASCVAVHFVFSGSAVVPFLPGLLYAFHYLALFTFSSASVGNLTTAKERESPTSEGENTMWRDVYFLVSTTAQRWMALGLVFVVVMVVLAIAIALDVPFAQEEVTNHKERILWCPATTVTIVAVTLMVMVVLVTGVVSFKSQHVAQNCDEKLATRETLRFLYTGVYFLPTFAAIMIASLVIFFVVRDARYKLATLLYSLVLIQLTYFFSMFGGRLSYIRKHGEEVLSRSLSDTQVAEVLSDTLHRHSRPPTNSSSAGNATRASLDFDHLHSHVQSTAI